MPTILTHALAGATVAEVAKCRPLVFASAILAMSPDADTISFYWDIPYQSMLGHRGLTHSFAFATVVGLAAACMSPAAKRLRAGICLALATASHGVLDALTNGGRGVAFFAPFSDERFFFPLRPIEVSPIGLRFFSERGLTVLASEMGWVWLPLLAANLAWHWRKQQNLT
jgi:inner membrane protein